MPTALITGVTGQDGSYLTELLLAKGYRVHGIVRRSSSVNTARIETHTFDPHDKRARLFLHYGDLADAGGLRSIIDRVAPDEIYNLGAQSHVRVSFDQPEYTADIVGTGTLRLLEAVRHYAAASGRAIKVYQAGSSEMYGSTPAPQSEVTPFKPRSPYAVGKVAAHHFATNYREAYGLFVANGILFNHESPRRGETFVTRKITRALGRIKFGLQDTLYLGNLEARRDWGFAGDYVEAMWLMLQQENPTTASSPQEKAIPFRSSWRSPRAAPMSTGSAMSRSTRATSDRPKSMFSRVMRPGRGHVSAGSRGSISESWSP